MRVVLGQQDIEDLDARYMRVGHMDQGRICDLLVKAAVSLQSGQSLPSRWQMLYPIDFIEKYGEGSWWSKTNSYHLFVYNGMPLFRIWTNTKADFAWVDLSTELAGSLIRHLVIEDIPVGNLKKCKPFVKRSKISKVDDVALLIVMMRDLYAICNV